MKMVSSTAGSRVATSNTIKKKGLLCFYGKKIAESRLVEEADHPLHELLRLQAPKLHKKEAMILPFRLQKLRLPFPPALLQLLVVNPPPLPQHIQLRNAHQHSPAAQRRQARRTRCHRIDPRVIKPRRLRTHSKPQRIDILRLEDFLLPAFYPLISNPILPPKERMNHHQPFHLLPLSPKPYSQVVHYVPARAFSAYENPF
ncbi:hypothetical protein M5K25_020492 [Dendrobium thyrsiflorum]|uniref:Uncharacterized protein n=1 Tax=Dendrobium thyrsiflorum TaxID=117978 RepID=A0ABD0UA46_DENTH